MRPGRISILVLLGMLSMAHPVIAQQSATEAPPGFDTPTLAVNPGSQSTSNGIAQPNDDTFAHDQQIYEQIHDVNSGLVFLEKRLYSGGPDRAVAHIGDARQSCMPSVLFRRWMSNGGTIRQAALDDRSRSGRGRGHD